MHRLQINWLPTETYIHPTRVEGRDIINMGFHEVGSGMEITDPVRTKTYETNVGIWRNAFWIVLDRYMRRWKTTIWT